MLIFFDLLERYTIWHLDILTFLSNPNQRTYNNSELMMQSLVDFLSKVMNGELDYGVIRKICKDLQMDGLISEGDYIDQTLTAFYLTESRTTQMGNEFLAFISDDGIVLNVAEATCENKDLRLSAEARSFLQVIKNRMDQGRGELILSTDDEECNRIAGFKNNLREMLIELKRYGFISEDSGVDITGRIYIGATELLKVVPLE